jgi:hypothetical protein
MGSLPWKICGVQLDLARQMERIDWILGFTDFLARHRFNTLVLYLEGRIRTPSFPWPSTSESYAPSEMRRVVARAAKHGIEVIPVVSTGGHAEMFLRHRQLHGLSELRGPWPGRFEREPTPGRLHQAFCPSLERTWEFLGDYLPEVAEIFPSRWFHSGLDEIWDFACCPLCRRFARGEKRQAALFAEVIRRSHRIISGACGKRMIMWDDLLEHYPSAIPKIPRDVALAAWHYDDVIQWPEGHFSNRPRIDKLALYRTHGLDAMIVTREFNTQNVETFTDYGARRRPLGGFVSIWEKSLTFHEEAYPVLAFAGRLWSSRAGTSPDKARRDGLRAIFPRATPSDLEVLALANARPPLRHLPTDLFSHLRGPLSSRERERRDANAIILSALARLARTGTAGGNPTARAERARILEDLRGRLVAENLHLEMRELATEALRRCASGENPHPFLSRLAKWRRLLARLRADRIRSWRATRRGLPANALLALFEQAGRLADQVATLARGRSARGYLRLHSILPNPYARQVLALSIRSAGTKRWVPVASGVFKQGPLSDSADFEIWFPLAGNRPLAACRIESWGHGGQGLMFLEAFNRAGRFVPARILAQHGRVTEGENVLHDDLRWAWLGEADSDPAFYNMERARRMHTLTLSMRRDPVSNP